MILKGAGGACGHPPNSPRVENHAIGSFYKRNPVGIPHFRRASHTVGAQTLQNRKTRLQGSASKTESGPVF